MTYRELFENNQEFYYLGIKHLYFYYPVNNHTYYHIFISGDLTRHTHTLPSNENISEKCILGVPDWAKNHSGYQKMKHEIEFNKKINGILNER